MWAFAASSLLGALSGLLSAACAVSYDRVLRRKHTPDTATLLAALAPSRLRLSIHGTGVAGQLCALLLAGSYTWFVSRLGWSGHAFALALQAFLLCVLALVDTRTRLLPDALNLPLFFTGMTTALQSSSSVGPQGALLGALVGYGFLWLLSALFSHFKNTEGMGQGDIKLAGALGACCGVSGILHVLLLASFAGTLFAIIHQRTVFAKGSYPFGPFLAGAGLAVILAQA